MERSSEINLAASKWPRRSKLSLQVNLVTPNNYMTKFQGIFISQKMTFSYGGDDKHGPLTSVRSSTEVTSTCVHNAMPRGVNQRTKS